jgi:hypothetical protein
MLSESVRWNNRGVRNGAFLGFEIAIESLRVVVTSLVISAVVVLEYAIEKS